MRRNMIILLSCLLVLLIACQKENAQQKANHSEDVNKNSDNNEHNEETITLPDAPLQKGEESEDIKTLQQALTGLDYPIESSGIYDDLTTWAITDIQLQRDIPISGIYDNDTQKEITHLIEKDEKISVGKGLDEPKHPGKYPEKVENPYDVLALVNKNHALPDDYEPEDLVIPDVRFPYEEDIPKKYLRQVAADALEEMINAGDEDGVTIFGQSGFRSYDRQETIFASNVAKNGEEHANTYSAKAGESEHQTGLVMDITSQDVGFDLNTDFGETEEGKWVKDHAHEYGFIIRYPEDKEAITQYQYEPWHLRYVGEKAATAIYQSGESFEEYLNAE